MNIAQPTRLGNGASAPPGTPEHHHYWREQLAVESSRAMVLSRHNRWPPNPELQAGVRAYWENLFNEGNNGSSTTETT